MKNRQIRIAKTDSDFERELLLRPFGFKGGYMTEIWQTAIRLEGSGGRHATGLCTQNVLWSDASIFSAHSESGGNALMYGLTQYALQLSREMTFHTPLELLDQLLEPVHARGIAMTGNPDLKKTFTLNALVGIDIAAWILFAREHGIADFDEMIPLAYRPALPCHHKQIASIPLIAYSLSVQDIIQVVDQGYFFMKIKLGQPGSQEEMLRRDQERLTDIHAAIGKRETGFTRNGKLPYYLDANGRYEKKETLLALLAHAEKIGALDQIALIEEPFPEESEIPVDDLGVRIAADESAHTAEDALKRIQLGYSALALKPIAKTLSMTLRIADIAHQHHLPCFCADLTVNPILVEWNKAVAARLEPLPGLESGLLESNGHQNYREWDRMRGYLPYPDADWSRPKEGIFSLNKDYYEKEGGIFLDSRHYEELFTRNPLS